MNIKFTVEESNLISIFESESREAVIQNILDTKKYVDDMEMLEVMSRVFEKLNSYFLKVSAKIEKKKNIPC